MIKAESSTSVHVTSVPLLVHVKALHKDGHVSTVPISICVSKIILRPHWSYVAFFVFWPFPSVAPHKHQACETKPGSKIDCPAPKVWLQIQMYSLWGSHGFGTNFLKCFLPGNQLPLYVSHWKRVSAHHLCGGNRGLLQNDCSKIYPDQLGKTSMTGDSS